MCFNYGNLQANSTTDRHANDTNMYNSINIYTNSTNKYKQYKGNILESNPGRWRGWAEALPLDQAWGTKKEGSW